MTGEKFSIVIPYKQRLHNIGVVLASLADQTMDAAEFEVIVGAMEYSPDYAALCREFTGRLRLLSLMTAEEWNVGRARNMAMRHASGQVTVVLDADMAVPPECLRGLYDRYFAGGQNVCVLGQMAGYDEVDGTNVEPWEFDELPYAHHRETLAKLAEGGQVRTDPRWELDEVPLPWTLVWTALVALPTATIRRHGLLFDERFRGWGPEDQEWGYRVHATGTPIVRGEDVYGLHLPHARDGAANWASDRSNSRYFLAKWPCLDVELSRAFGWNTANRGYADIKRDLARATAEGATADGATADGATGDGAAGGGVVAGGGLGVARGTIAGADVLLVGALVDGQARLRQPQTRALFDSGCEVQILPLAGFALPYPDKSVVECRILPPIARLSARCRDTVLAESQRVSRQVVCPGSATVTRAGVSGTSATARR